MKLPVSKLKSEKLEALFKKSSIMEQYFFPRTVPSLPSFDSSEDKKESDLSLTAQGQGNDKSLEKN